MILKKIFLENIRSYDAQEVVFPEGSTLLSGDIGSGKTTVLLGIEFALFGLQPGQKGSSLLKNGADQGKISMEFEVDGKVIEVERKLKRGKTVSQDSCHIIINGEKKVISVMELKSIILDLLSYPREFSKKQNLLYKFTVYTPQEEMKQIILQDPVTRINTLRHIFGIDKYKKIIENTSLLTGKLREQIRVKEALISNIDREKEEVSSKENELETKQYNLISVEKDFFLKAEERKKIQEEKELISVRIEEKIKVQQEIERAKIMISNKNESISNNLKTIERLRFQISEYEKIRFDEAEFKEIENKLLSKNKEKNEINENLIRISIQINSVILKNQDNQNIIDKIKHIETCPTCMQKVEITYKDDIFKRLNLEISKNLDDIENLKKDKEIIFNRTKNLNENIIDLGKKVKELNELKIKAKGLKEKQVQVEELEKTNVDFQKEVELMKLKVIDLESSISELKKFDEEFERLKSSFETALKEERIAEIKVAELRREIQVFSSQIDELKEKISKTEKIKEEMDYIKKLENWLSNKFVSLISFIEKNVMVKLKYDFSDLFSKWFSILVTDSLTVELDDDFTPLIKNQDYEIDYEYLSGGERTAVALAYRLSLNQIINSILSKIKTRDIVVLDEPTDGFSAQQLNKMRDVLEQLNVRQLIIVSHEEKIESFVENVIKIRKENGISVIG